MESQNRFRETDRVLEIVRGTRQSNPSTKANGAPTTVTNKNNDANKAIAITIQAIIPSPKVANIFL